MNEIPPTPAPSVHDQSINRLAGFADLTAGPAILFISLHVALGLGMAMVPPLATAHALATLAVGMWFAGSGRYAERVAYVGAYIVAAEVAWRMTGSQVPYEFGKYGICLVFLVSILRHQNYRLGIFALVYFALLLPSIPFTFAAMDFETARQQVSFNLSGPFAMMVSIWFLSNLNLYRHELSKIILAMLGPVAAIATMGIYNLITARAIEFSFHSNRLLSSISSNQLSSALGLGMLMAFVWVVINPGHQRILSLVLVACILVFGITSALTFSRGGLYMAIASGLLLTGLTLKQSRARLRILVVAALFFILVEFLLLPFLNDITHGAFEVRLGDLSPSKRDRIAEADLAIFQENWLSGIGPGVAPMYRHELISLTASAHTEFTRVLAEHGIFGLLSLTMVLLMTSIIIGRDVMTMQWSVKVSFVLWALLYLSINGMRLAAPSFMFGLACSNLILEKVNPANDA